MLSKNDKFNKTKFQNYLDSEEDIFDRDFITIHFNFQKIVYNVKMKKIIYQIIYNFKILFMKVHKIKNKYLVQK